MVAKVTSGPGMTNLVTPIQDLSILFMSYFLFYLRWFSATHVFVSLETVAYRERRRTVPVDRRAL